MLIKEYTQPVCDLRRTFLMYPCCLCCFNLNRIFIRCITFDVNIYIRNGNISCLYWCHCNVWTSYPDMVSIHQNLHYILLVFFDEAVIITILVDAKRANCHVRAKRNIVISVFRVVFLLAWRQKHAVTGMLD